MKRIEEIYWLRCYGCLAVFGFHFLDRINQHRDHLALDLARIPTVLGTPTFIFISIFLFSARYGNAIPEGFLANRVKYVMVPYLVYGLIYSTAEFVRVNAGNGEVGFVDNAVEYLIYAGWHGYFLIIAMQFYAFYWVYTRFGLGRFLAPGPGLVIGSLISIAYWGLTRLFHIDPPGYLLWIAPLGWLYLFFLALLLVRHYPHPERVPLLGELARPRWLVAMTGLVVLLSLPGWLEYSSKETWTIPLFILFTLWAMSRLHGRPATPLVRRINEYSFGIYLAHPLFFGVVDFLDQRLAFPLPLYALLLVTAGLAGSVGLNVLVNRLSWGGLMFGKRLRVA
ncbi:acyltransferase family protein [Halomonas sp. EGI 63088]|uniref:Acyltransferase family protein n=1 Tax=Halomonas flagellata TaxID=2920385 RepID=A0ABS9RQZ1_9GAMM|nr:acyltransferase family protein [Halomonas flagellata]MCH4562272.1 acyltransferase family protein [Halomonas flagellata]